MCTTTAVYQQGSADADYLKKTEYLNRVKQFENMELNPSRPGSSTPLDLSCVVNVPSSNVPFSNVPSSKVPFSNVPSSNVPSSYVPSSHFNVPSESEPEMKRSLTCTVCHGDSGNFYLNYGAAACFSCRAFFRRIVQGNTEHKLKCRAKMPSGTLCDIQHVGKKCRKCRYEKCMIQGMRANKVLGKDEKKFRFRKSIKRKMCQEKQHEVVPNKQVKLECKEMTLEEKNSAAENHEDKDYKDREFSSKEFPASIAYNEYSSSEEETPDSSSYTQVSTNKSMAILFKYGKRPLLNYVCLKGDPVPSFVSPFAVCQNKKKFRTLMYGYKGQLDKTWHTATQNMNPNRKFIENLIKFHQGRCFLSRDLLKHHFVTLAKCFTDFALQQEFFKKLNIQDQRKLLIQNTPLFAQFILTQCFNATSGRRQISYWLGVSDCDYLTDFDSSLHVLSLTSYNVMTHWFSSPKDLDYFKGMMEETFQTAKVPFELIALVAKLCLVHSECGTFLHNRKGVLGEQEELFTYTDWANEVYGHPNSEQMKNYLLRFLEMNTWFMKNASWVKGSDPLFQIDKTLKLAKSGNDFYWLKSQLSFFDEAFQLVPMSEEHIKAAVRKDVKPFAGNMRYDAALWLERYRLILKSSEDPRVREVVPYANYLSAFILSQVKIQSCCNLLDQLIFITGRVDTTLDNVGPKEVLKEKYCLTGVSKSNPNAISYSNTIIGFSDSLFPLIKDNAVFKLLLLICLCDTEHTKQMMRCLTAHLDLILNDDSDSFTNQNSNALKINQVLSVLKRVTAMGQSLQARLKSVL